MSAAAHDPAVDPGYVRELLGTIRELVDAAIACRPYVVSAVDAYGVSDTPASRAATRRLEELDTAIAEGQARL